MCKVVNLYKEPYDVYIGRAGKGKRCLYCGMIHNESGTTLDEWSNEE